MKNTMVVMRKQQDVIKLASDNVGSKYMIKLQPEKETISELLAEWPQTLDANALLASLLFKMGS